MRCRPAGARRNPQAGAGQRSRSIIPGRPACPPKARCRTTGSPASATARSMRWCAKRWWPIPTCASRARACARPANYSSRRAHPCFPGWASPAPAASRHPVAAAIPARRCRASLPRPPGSWISGVACDTRAMPPPKTMSPRRPTTNSRASPSPRASARAWFTAIQLSEQAKLAGQMVDVVEPARQTHRRPRTRRRRHRTWTPPWRAPMCTTSRTRWRRPNTRATRRCVRSSCCWGGIRRPRSPRAADFVAMPPAPPVGVPLAMLERRPDVIAAERRVAAAFNRIGQAKAARLPQITLNLNFGAFESDILELQGRFRESRRAAPARACSPLSTRAARLNANVRIRTLQQEEALAAYAGTALQALNDVENAIAAGRSLAARARALGAAFGEQQRALELTETSLRVGRADRRALEQQRTVGGQCAHRAARRAGRGTLTTHQPAPGSRRQLRSPAAAAAAVIAMPVRQSIEFSRSRPAAAVPAALLLPVRAAAGADHDLALHGRRARQLPAGGIQRLHRAVRRGGGGPHGVVVSAGIRA